MQNDENTYYNYFENIEYIEYNILNDKAKSKETTINHFFTSNDIEELINNFKKKLRLIYNLRIIFPIYKVTILDENDKLIGNIDKYDISEYIGEAANTYYKLTVLHPFSDGNERMTRTFMSWLLRLKGLCPIYIDSENKDEYLEALNRMDVGEDNSNLQIIIIKGIIKITAELHNSWNHFL